jgi:hypothetical protein
MVSACLPFVQSVCVHERERERGERGQHTHTHTCACTLSLSLFPLSPTDSYVNVKPGPVQTRFNGKEESVSPEPTRDTPSAPRSGPLPAHVSAPWVGMWDATTNFYQTKLDDNGCHVLDDNNAAAAYRPVRSPATIRLEPRPVLFEAGGCLTPESVDAGYCIVSKKGGFVTCLPSLVIIGVMKGGTAELQGWLSQHPALWRYGGPSKTGAGEAHYFDFLESDEELEKTWLTEYARDGFKLPKINFTSSHYTFEKTPG